MVAQSETHRVASSRVVLDVSVTMAWFFDDESDPFAEAITTDVAIAEFLVPTLWRIEVANTLVVGERRKRNTASQSSAFLAEIDDLPIVSDPNTTTNAWGSIIDLARTHQLSAYDAAYLELAIREKIPIATLDNALRAAAVRVGVSLYAPSS